MSEKQEAILPVVPLVPGNEPTGRPLVELTHVEKYFGDLHVLKDINLTVNKGEVLVVVGPSGSGKSTMCRTINRLETIESGDIRIDGKALPQEGRQLAQLRAEVGMGGAEGGHLLTCTARIASHPQHVGKGRGEHRRPARGRRRAQQHAGGVRARRPRPASRGVRAGRG